MLTLTADTPDAYAAALNTHPQVLVDYYKDNCPGCRMLDMSLNKFAVTPAAEGITAHRWLWCKRLDASQHLLATGQARQVSEAALSCGFNDLSHFCKAFKAAYGMKPSQCLHAATG